MEEPLKLFLQNNYPYFDLCVCVNCRTKKTFTSHRYFSSVKSAQLLSAPIKSAYVGDVGSYAGDVGSYAGDVGSYAGDVGMYAGEEGIYAGDVRASTSGIGDKLLSRERAPALEDRIAEYSLLFGCLLNPAGRVFLPSPSPSP